MKPYHKFPIVECGEKLIAIPPNFAFTDPHAYQVLGAPYGDRSPFYLRQGVVQSAIAALEYLQKAHPHWRIKIFDAYRPVAVQQFMVDRETAQLARARGWNIDELTNLQHKELMDRVLQFWAIPSSDPRMPPPHSTGAAVDVTLVDRDGREINMGSAIDEISHRSFPNYFQAGKTAEEAQFHANRELLCQVMAAAGFQRHPDEWWHFSLGDQMWAWLVSQQQDSHRASEIFARYGRYE